MMKALYRVSIFCVLILLSAFGIYFLLRFFYPTPEKTERVKKESQKKIVSTTGSGDKTTCDTEYIIIEQDLDAETSNTYIEKIPDKYIDKTREQIIDILLEEERAPVLSEKEKGLIGVSLSSFSVYRIVVIRQYRKQEEAVETKSKKRQDEIFSDEPEETDDVIEFTGGYYLIAYDDHVYVYQSDMKTLYMMTEICINDLPEHLVQEIMDKKYLKDDADLYNFLESYSS